MSVYPNPSGESCELEYETIEQGRTRIYIINTFGEVIKQLSEFTPAMPGTDKLTINTGDMPAGVYFIRMQTPTIKKTIKMEVVR
jgi:hypothetical protein